MRLADAAASQIVEIPESVAEIGSYAFVRCGSMEGILLPDGFGGLR